MRNELRQGGFSSAQRGTGRGCLLERNLMTDTPVTGYAQEEVCRLLELSREASDAYRAAVHGRKIRQAVAEKVGPELRKYEQGEKVYYFRDEARGIRWRGPAVVVGYNPDMKTYVVSSGGRIIHVGWRHLKSAEERGEEEPKVGAKAEEVAKAEERADEQQATGGADQNKQTEVPPSAAEVLPSTPLNPNAANTGATPSHDFHPKETTSSVRQNGTTEPNGDGSHRSCPRVGGQRGGDRAQPMFQGPDQANLCATVPLKECGRRAGAQSSTFTPRSADEGKGAAREATYINNNFANLA